MSNTAFELILEKLPLAELLRIDAALEGAWSDTMTTIWTREQGFLSFSKVINSHSTLRPSLELYFDGIWLGIHCFKSIGNVNHFDEALAYKIVDSVDKKIKHLQDH